MLRCVAINMFPYTDAVEAVCLLSKLKSDKYIDVEVEMDEFDLTVAESKATYKEIRDHILEKYDVKISALHR